MWVPSRHGGVRTRGVSLSARKDPSWLKNRSVSTLIIRTRSRIPPLSLRTTAPIPVTARPNRRGIVRSADMSTWWERDPDIWQREQTALDASGYQWEQDQAALSAGQVVLRIQAPQPGVGTLVAVFPATYPYFPPQVWAEPAVASRHQQPFTGALCLLARDGEGWDPRQDTLAGLLDAQLPKVLAVDAKLQEDDEFVAANEDHVGEPLSLYLYYRPESCVIVPDVPPPTLQSSGKLAVRIRAMHDRRSSEPFLAIVEGIQDVRGNAIAEGFKQVEGFSEPISGYWMRLPSRPAQRTSDDVARALLRDLRAANKDFDKALRNSRKGSIFITGFVYPDEVRWREAGDDWVFMLVEITQVACKSNPGTQQLQFIRTDWGGDKAWMRRAPFLHGVRDKTVLVVGLGSIGSPVALQLARAGVRSISLVDHDHLQIGNTVRWALGWQYAGLSKASAIARHIQREYPRTEAIPHVLRIGAPSAPGGEPDDEIMRSLIKRADLVVDASAEFLVNRYLADLCSELGRAYIWLTTTHGAAGGIVGRVVPGRRKGCWHCFQHALNDETIRLPAVGDIVDLEAAGCSMPTFVGAGMDSDAISVLAARLAIATLCIGAQEAYPDFLWNVAVVDTYRGATPIAPEWLTYPLERHEACQSCVRA